MSIEITKLINANLQPDGFFYHTDIKKTTTDPVQEASFNFH